MEGRVCRFCLNRKGRMKDSWYIKHFLDSQPFNIGQLQLDPHGGMGWQHLRLPERYIRKAIAWYRQHFQSPREWRPHVIIAALHKAVFDE